MLISGKNVLGVRKLAKFSSFTEEIIKIDNLTNISIQDVLTMNVDTLADINDFYLNQTNTIHEISKA